MTIETILMLFGAGLLSGVVNAVAGGSTFLTFPILMASGLSPLVANATNFVAVFPGNLMALPAYKKELRSLGRGFWWDLLAAGLGGAVGAYLLIWSGEAIFTGLVPWLMAFATAIFALSPHIRKHLSMTAKSQRSFGLVMLFAFAIYGGYFGAGLGVILLGALALIGYSQFHMANAAKNALNVLIGIIGIAILAKGDLIEWTHAAPMMAGAIIGGYYGIPLSRFLPEKILRAIIITLGCFLTIYYFAK